MQGMKIHTQTSTSRVLQEKKWDWVFVTLWQYYVLKLNKLCAILKKRLWEFQNGKMGKNSSKIEQDTAKTVKRIILKNNNCCGFRWEKHNF